MANFFGVVVGCAFVAIGQITFGQVVVEVDGASGSNDDATEFSAAPTPAGKLEFFAIQSNGDATLTVKDIQPGLYGARITMTGANGQPAFVEYILDEVSGVGFVVDSSSNVDPSDPFIEYNSAFRTGPGWMPGQDYIYVKDSAGTVHIPETAGGFIDTLTGIAACGNTVDTIIIKGHGCDEVIGCGPGAGLTCSNGVITIVYENPNTPSVDITNLLDSVCTAGTSIRLRGCFTAPLAGEIRDSLTTCTNVKGAIRFVIGVPWTPWGIGVYR